MKRVQKPVLLPALLLLTVLTAGFFSLKGVIGKVYIQLEGYRSDFLAKIEEKTGLRGTYAAVSPSLFTAFRMRSIALFDDSGNTPLVSAASVVFSYDIGKLLQGDVAGAVKKLRFSSLVLDGKRSLDFCRQVQKKFPPAKNTGSGSLVRDIFGDIEIQARNVTVLWEDDGSSLRVKITRLSYRTDLGYFGQAKGRGTLEGELKGTGKPVPVRGAVSVTASLAPGLYGSTATVTLDMFQGGSVGVSSLSFLVDLQKTLLRVTSLKNSLPFFAVFEAALPSGDWKGIVRAEELNPLNLVILGKETEKRFAGASMNVTASGEGSFTAGEVFYRGKGEAVFPRGVLEGGIRVDFDLQGANEKVAVEELRVRSMGGENSAADLLFSGKLDLKKLLPSGLLRVNRLPVSPGRYLSADIALTPEAGGFRVTIPPLALGEARTGETSGRLQVNPHRGSLDFDAASSLLTFSPLPQSLPEEALPPPEFHTLRARGNLIFSSPPRLTAGVNAEGLPVDEVLKALTFFAPEAESAAKALKGLSADLAGEVTTDFTTLSYSVPLATVRSGEKILGSAAVEGTEKEVRVSGLTWNRPGLEGEAEAAAQFPRGKQSVTFQSHFQVNGENYALRGEFTPAVGVTLTGDYGLTAALLLPTQEQGWRGYVGMTELPVALGEYRLLVTVDTASGKLNSPNLEDLEVLLSGVTVAEVSGNLPTSPVFFASGRLEGGKLNLNTVTLKDTVSSLRGSSTVILLQKSGIIQSINATLQLQAVGTQESYTLEGLLTNYALAEVTAASFLRFPLSITLEVENSPLQRFLSDQGEDQVVRALVEVWGTLENPDIQVRVEDTRVNAGPVPLALWGNFSFSPGAIHAAEATVMTPWGGVSSLGGEFSLSEKWARARGDLSLTAGDTTISGPVTVMFEPKFVPGKETGAMQTFAVQVASEGMTSSLFPIPESFDITMTRDEKSWRVATERGRLEVLGEWTAAGAIQASVQGSSPLKFKAQGVVTSEKLEIEMKDVYLDASRIGELLSSSVFALHRGIFTGEMKVTGTPDRPDFTGKLAGTQILIRSPKFVAEELASPEAVFTIERNRLSSGTMYFTTENGKLLLADLQIQFSRWALEELVLNLKTAPGAEVNMNMQLPRIGVETEAATDLTIIYAPGTVAVTGKATVQEGVIQIESVLSENLNRLLPVAGGTSAVTKTLGAVAEFFGVKKTPANEMPPAAGSEIARKHRETEVVTDLTFTAGNRFQVQVNPILRGLVAPGTEVTLKMNTALDIFDIGGDVLLRGGEIQWFNRNFYLREGRVVFAENDAFDPRLTIRAEVRERDAEGEPVLISIQAENQRLSEFTPTYMAMPAKSETEIMTLLGQNVIGNVENTRQALVTGSDILLQLTVLRRIENGLRELLNFDIFSLRATWLQNMLNNDSSRMSETAQRRMTLGSVFNNSTVYIGKYMTHEVYFDALLHFLYDESKLIENPSATGMVLQPEIGLEVATPFATMRWSFAPELSSVEQMLSPSEWVPSTTVTFSWRWDLENPPAFLRRPEKAE